MVDLGNYPKLPNKFKICWGGLSRKGLPIGNLTSQLFANIYLDELDQFIKHKLSHKNAIAFLCDTSCPTKYYLRYSDDFILITDNENCLRLLILQIDSFLKSELKLTLHPNKIIIKKLRQGIDFLGYVVLPDYTVLRTRTKKRMMKRVNEKNLTSYLGLLKHCRGIKLVKKLKTN